jgi:hypothetical protein
MSASDGNVILDTTTSSIKCLGQCDGDSDLIDGLENSKLVKDILTVGMASGGGSKLRTDLKPALQDNKVDLRSLQC